MRHVLVALALVLAGCAGQDEILPGERVDLRAPFGGGNSSPAAVPGSAPISLPAPQINSVWTHVGGSATHRIPHPQLGQSLSPVWSVKIGDGNTRGRRITAAPVIAGGRVFAMDSQTRVSAVSTSGALLWRRDLTPAGERRGDASGGGLAVQGRRVFVTTGYGELVALNAETGAEIWRQDLDAAASGSPTVAGDLVYAVSRDSRAWAVRVVDGRVAWELPGTPSPAGYVGGPGPAIAGDLVIFPFSSGELVAADRVSGVRKWAASVAGQRPGKVYARIGDISADPVVAGGAVYTGNPSGRSVALRTGDGGNIWTAREGAMDPVAVEGGSVFLLSDQNELVRLDAASGAKIWGTQLPLYTARSLRARKGIHAHYGPILAGGRLIVASGDGQLRSFEPVSGRQVSAVKLPGGAASRPAVAGGVLYVVNTKGQLWAYR